MLGSLYYIAYLVCGLILSSILLNNYKRHQILVIGLSVGTVLAAWVPVAVSMILKRFDIFTNLLALAIVVVGTVVYLFVNSNIKTLKKTWNNRDNKDEIAMFITVLPFTILIIWLFSGHILLPRNGSLYGGQSTYGDLSMHMGMITSIARQGVFPPDYSILPGTRLSYPFLVNSLSSSLYLFGTSLRNAIIIPSIIMSFVCFAGFYLVAKKVSVKNKSAVVATLLFFITGGLGVIYFLGDATLFKNIFTGFYQTPVNLPKMNLRWVNVICDMMVPQRTSLMGWSVLFIVMLILYTGIKNKLASKSDRFFSDTKELFIAGVIAGLMPMIHTHSFLGLGILCAGSLMVGLLMPSIDMKKYIAGFTAFVIPVIILATPQLFFWVFTQSGGFVKKHLDWVNDGWPWLKFWVINVGLPFLLIIPAIIWGRKKYLIPFCGAILIYVIAEVIVFQPNYYDNNKLLLVWYMVMCIIVGDFLVYFIEKIKYRFVQVLTCVILAVVLFTSGSLSIIREVISNGQYRLYSWQHIEAAEAIDKYTPKDSLILTAGQHLNAPAALSGRDIFVGTPTYLFFHGFDLTNKQNEAKLMYTDIEKSPQLLEENNIDYVYFSSYEMYQYKNMGGIFEIYPEVFKNPEVKIFAISKRAQEIGEFER